MQANQKNPKVLNQQISADIVISMDTGKTAVLTIEENQEIDIEEDTGQDQAHLRVLLQAIESRFVLI